MDFSWALEYPDLHKICNLFQMYELLSPVRFKYTPLKELLQDGPQCGLVALAMFTDNVSKDTVSQLYHTAKEQGFTINGEMFSASDLCVITNSFTKYDATVYSGNLNNEFIKDFLVDGGFMLVPYDADKNHGPWLCRGHKAHWAAVSGIIETEDNTYVLAKHDNEEIRRYQPRTH